MLALAALKLRLSALHVGADLLLGVAGHQPEPYSRSENSEASNEHRTESGTTEKVSKECMDDRQKSPTGTTERSSPNSNNSTPHALSLC